MSLINANINVVIYADEPRTMNPNVKFADLTWSLLGLPTGTPKEIPIYLNPGESKTILLSTRTLTFTGGTSFDIQAVTGTSNARLVGNFGARTARTDGDATTEWAITKTNNLVKLQFTGTGTAPNFATMLAGDGVFVDAPFGVLNRGYFVIVKVGVNYVEFMNPIASNETTVGQIQIFSSGPVQVGDILDLTNPAFSYPNRGQFQILAVTDSFIEFSNPNVVPETGITGITSGLYIYLESMKWMLMAIDHRVIVKLNGDTGTGVEVEPPVDGDIVRSPGLFFKRGKVFELVAENPGLEPASGMVLLSP